MSYKIYSVQSMPSILLAEPFPIKYTLWNSKESPASFGRLGYITNEALIIQLQSNQSDPLRTYFEINSPVYKDSALEFFLQAELNNPNYLNFEVNANGAILVQYGESKNRTYLTEEQIKTCSVHTEINSKSWNIILFIPLSFLHIFYPNLLLQKDHLFRFNLYKICESVEHEHYMSLTSIPTKTPNFHLPQYFADGVLF